jgi:hypothetical protein
MDQWAMDNQIISQWKKERFLRRWQWKEFSYHQLATRADHTNNNRTIRWAFASWFHGFLDMKEKKLRMLKEKKKLGCMMGSA